ncbi:MAG: KH domain-containing protein [Pseudomonadales bacterium]|jgi:spoIIIJ-associated protein|nr:KH domain-containing protein [Pseudomonadales bacterium]
MKLNEFLSKLLDSLLLDGYDVEIAESEDKILIDIKVSSEDSGIVIGRKGEVLISMQRLLRVLFAEEIGDKKLILNINDYRAGREEKIREMVHRAAQKVFANGRPYTMRNLNSAERYIVHQTISEDESLSELVSFSEGEG